MRDVWLWVGKARTDFGGGLLVNLLTSCSVEQELQEPAGRRKLRIRELLDEIVDHVAVGHYVPSTPRAGGLAGHLYGDR